MKITDEQIADYDIMIHDNSHGELLEEIAIDFNLGYYEKLFKAINTIHDAEGYLEGDVRALRNRFKEEMKHDIKLVLSHEDYRIMQKYI